MWSWHLFHKLKNKLILVLITYTSTACGWCIHYYYACMVLWSLILAQWLGIYLIPSNFLCDCYQALLILIYCLRNIMWTLHNYIIVSSFTFPFIIWSMYKLWIFFNSNNTFISELYTYFGKIPQLVLMLAGAQHLVTLNPKPEGLLCHVARLLLVFRCCDHTVHYSGGCLQVLITGHLNHSYGNCYLKLLDAQRYAIF